MVRLRAKLAATWNEERVSEVALPPSIVRSTTVAAWRVTVTPIRLATAPDGRAREQDARTATLAPITRWGGRLVIQVSDLAAHLRATHEGVAVLVTRLANGAPVAGATAELRRADGVVVGTRFWASAEAAVSPAAQQATLALSGDDTIRQHVFDLVRHKDWPAEYSGRVVNNDFISRWHGHEADVIADLTAMTAQYQTALAEDDYTVANMTVGESIGLVRVVQTAEEIITGMIEQATACASR